MVRARSGLVGEPHCVVPRQISVSRTAAIGVESGGQATLQRRHCDLARRSAIVTRSPHDRLQGLPPSLRSTPLLIDSARIRLDDGLSAALAFVAFAESVERLFGPLGHLVG